MQMRRYVLKTGSSSLDDLALIEMATPEPGPGEVLIRVRACSLNYRDQAVVTGNYFGGKVTQDLVPLSDGAGEVEAVGAGVTKFKTGDRVQGLFFQNWWDGPPNPNAGPALGANPIHGMLSEYVVLPERGVGLMAASLTFEEAACLPCAGVTAWHALMEGPRSVKPGDTVLVLGTGGVSLTAMAIAKAAGARVIATSSSNDKLDRAKALGADIGINYKDVPEWGPEAAKLAGPGGISHVIEVGGAGTLAQSYAAVGFNGEVSLIGVLTRGESGFPHALMMKGAWLRGIFVGSGRMAQSLNAAVDSAGIKPVIGKTFAFEQARQAYEYQASPDLFGKVVIAV
jgi:NADPH:quinone reductase-like Zn-dependent oxidoreductase